MEKPPLTVAARRGARDGADSSFICKPLYWRAANCGVDIVVTGNLFRERQAMSV
jgi:hypothetical protein